MEGEAGAGEEPCFPVAGEALDAGGLGGGQLDRGNLGRAGLAAAGGQRRPAGVELQLSSADGFLAGGVRARGGFPAAVSGGGRAGADGDADGGGPELGECGQGGVLADRVVCPGLGLVPAEGVLSRFEGDFNQPPVMPMKWKSSLAWCPDRGRYWAWEHCCRRRPWFAGCGQRQQVSVMRPSAGNAVTLDPLIWAMLPRERRAAVVALLALLAARAAAGPAGGGRDEPGQVPAGGAAAAQDPARAPGPGGGGVCPPV